MSPQPFFGRDRDQPCFIIAEIGANHNGDLDLCLKTMEAAAKTGVDALKLQYYTARDLVADVDRVWAWGPEGNQTEERVGDGDAGLERGAFDLLACARAEGGVGEDVDASQKPLARVTAKLYVFGCHS